MKLKLLSVTTVITSLILSACGGSTDEKAVHQPEFPEPQYGWIIEGINDYSFDTRGELITWIWDNISTNSSNPMWEHPASGVAITDDQYKAWGSNVDSYYVGDVRIPDINGLIDGSGSSETLIPIYRSSSGIAYKDRDQAAATFLKSETLWYPDAVTTHDEGLTEDEATDEWVDEQLSKIYTPTGAGTTPSDSDFYNSASFNTYQNSYGNSTNIGSTSQAGGFCGIYEGFRSGNTYYLQLCDSDLKSYVGAVTSLNALYMNSATMRSNRTSWKNSNTIPGTPEYWTYNGQDYYDRSVISAVYEVQAEFNIAAQTWYQTNGGWFKTNAEALASATISSSTTISTVGSDWLFDDITGTNIKTMYKSESVDLWFSSHSSANSFKSAMEYNNDELYFIDGYSHVGTAPSIEELIQKLDSKIKEVEI